LISNFGLKIRVSLVRSRVEAPSFKPLQKCEGFFVLTVLLVVNTSDSKSIASDSVAVQVRPMYHLVFLYHYIALVQQLIHQ